MPSTAHDFGYLTSGVEDIESFLLSKNLFWPLSSSPPFGEPAYPRLTLGGILLSIARLRSRTLDFSEESILNSLELKLDHWRTSWRTTWERKAQREFESRLRQWNLYISELQLNPEGNIPYYDIEVRVRVLIDLIIPEINILGEQLLNQLAGLDVYLKSILLPGAFIWEDELSTGFDREKYWYLWGIPEIELLGI